MVEKIRKINKPFGNINLYFLETFFQLPPVGNNHDMDTHKFCFESEMWKQAFPITISLTKIYRQSDLRFSNILNSIRKGKITDDDFYTLVDRKIKLKDYDKNITIIAPKNYLVLKINKKDYQNYLPN